MAAGDELHVRRREAGAAARACAIPRRSSTASEILTDCLEQPAVVRELYDLAGEALKAEKSVWGAVLQGLAAQRSLSTSVQKMELFVGFLRRLRAMADEHAPTGSAPRGSRGSSRCSREELDEPYFELVESHLKALKFKGGMLMSAQLATGNKGSGVHAPPAPRAGPARAGVRPLGLQLHDPRPR